MRCCSVRGVVQEWAAARTCDGGAACAGACRQRQRASSNRCVHPPQFAAACADALALFAAQYAVLVALLLAQSLVALLCGRRCYAARPYLMGAARAYFTFLPVAVANAQQVLAGPPTGPLSTLARMAIGCRALTMLILPLSQCLDLAPSTALQLLALWANAKHNHDVCETQASAGQIWVTGSPKACFVSAAPSLVLRAVDDRPWREARAVLFSRSVRWRPASAASCRMGGVPPGRA